jgi:hypothetical protein
MATTSSLHSAAPIAAAAPYPAASVSRFIHRIDRLPQHGWWVYLALALFPAAWAHAVLWATGHLAVGSLEPLILVWMVYGPYGLAMLALMRATATRALSDFWPATGWPLEQQAEWRYRFANAPAGFGFACLAIGGVVSTVSLLAAPEGALGAASGDLWATALALLPMAVFGYSILPMAVVFTLHGMRLVTRIHREASAINPFDRSAVNAFSRLTAVGGLSYVAAAYYSLTVNGAFQAGNVASVLAVMASVAAGVAFFIVPLWGIHERIQREKSRLLLESETRADAVAAELYRRIDAGEFDTAKNLADALAGVAASRQRIQHLPTWPWPPELLRGFVSALLLPVAVYLVTRLVTSVIG